MWYLQVVPDTEYMEWQLRVQMANFKKHGIENQAIILVGYKGQPSELMRKFSKETEASVVFIEDTRDYTDYQPSIRPHLIAKYLEDFTNAEEIAKCMFYHDQDIIWLTVPDINKLEGDEFDYVAAGTKSYMSAAYLKGFKKYQFPTLCEIMGIDPAAVEANDEFAGGAQYIIKNSTPAFWRWVELKCHQVHAYLKDITTTGLKAWFPEEDLPAHHIQIWGTDLYVLYFAMLKKGQVRHAPEIDFYWPFDKNTGARPIMHNAGIEESNAFKLFYNILNTKNMVVASEVPADRLGEYINDKNPGFTSVEARRERRYFNKMNYLGGHTPFGEDHSYVSKEIAQHGYIELINELSPTPVAAEVAKKRKVLGIFCTHNKINKDLLALTLDRIRIAKWHSEMKGLCDVDIVTCSWEPIPNNPFKAHLSPFRDLDWLNYILQIKQALIANPGYDMVCILEHDMMYPPEYFNEVVSNWDYSKYGLCYNNYIGLNETGYCEVKARHHPLSLMSFAAFFLEKMLNEKIDMCIKRIDVPEEFAAKYGWVCIEPDDKSQMAQVGFTDHWPAMHVNMNHLSDWGNKDKNHHFTSHCVVCYEEDSKGSVLRGQDWGHYRDYFTFDNTTDTAKVLSLNQPALDNNY